MNDKLPISLVVITLNEERNIECCLRAADFCAEIIVVDSGSADRTLEIASRYGARIIHREWSGYRDQKDFGGLQADFEWILCIDADEVISPELRASIETAFQTGPDADAFEINRHTYYAGKRIDHSGWYPQWRLLLFRKGKAFWSESDPHETLIFRGEKKCKLAGDLYHFTYADFRQHVIKNLSYARAWANSASKSGRKTTIFDLLFRGHWAFVRTYFLQLGVLDGFYGLFIAVVASFYTFSKYAMLWELNRRETRDSGE